MLLGSNSALGCGSGSDGSASGLVGVRSEYSWQIQIAVDGDVGTLERVIAAVRTRRVHLDTLYYRQITDGRNPYLILHLRGDCEEVELLLRRIQRGVGVIRSRCSLIQLT